MTSSTADRVRGGAQVALGATLVGAGVAHLTVAREEFRNQVPPWLPLDEDFVVLASGVVEIGVGAFLLASWRQPRRALAGAIAALLFIAVFPGNIAQLTERRDAFGLDSDTARTVRLAFQPLLVAWALWSTDAWRVWRRRRS